jgi:hypothetical protein
MNEYRVLLGEKELKEIDHSEAIDVDQIELLKWIVERME